jgi:hypothetical protein
MAKIDDVAELLTEEISKTLDNTVIKTDIAHLIGNIQIDASVADQYITYSTDSKLLNESQKKCKKMIDKRYELSGKKDKNPRTY